MKLENLTLWGVPTEVKQSIDPNGGQEHWMIQHVPSVAIADSFMVQRLEEFLEEERMRILGFRRYVLSSC